ncbi:hypothetical protein [Arthrobacter caoxuetaonis]|uniref:Uncharacterized protein n=1 Tax=Arthrobacter caoxuetaonis TaxID=2886935 RepID=A0A9X1MGN3_9MICC|nr:hypothetical protein [Arthrobacter caoxuetaonis]MCC3299739.1 hypothetical protein [Arthrobacter caoxuetaonis]USQ59359.1 hypothetical protein NF551_17445 [Arthrobacter caoxuetaonis]
MSSRYVDEAVNTALHMLRNMDILPYDDIFEQLFDRCSPGLVLSQKVVLYPQFRQAVEPELLRQIRKNGLFGVVNGYWTHVAASQLLQEARAGDYLTPEEIRLEDRALGRTWGHH